MSFFARLLGRQENGKGMLTTNSNNKRQQPCSPPSGSFAPEFAAGRPSAAPPVPVKLQNGNALPQQQQQHQRASMDSDDDDCTIRVPGSIGAATDRNRSNSLARRRAAIDISPRAVQRLSDKVALLDAGHIDLDGGGVVRAEVDALYTDMQLIHRGRSSMVYRAREVRTGRRVILKAYDSHTLSNSTRKQALERHVLTLRAAQATIGPNGGLVALERVVENSDGTFLVVQACNGGTLIEAIANSGGKLPERQVAIKVALPLLTALRQLHSTGIVHRDIKPEHLMIHNGTLRLGDFGSAGCASCSAAALASTLQKQALGPGSKRRWHQSEHQQIDQQQLLEELEALEQQRQQQQHRHQQHHQQQHESHQQLHLQADCTAEATINCCQQPHSCDHLAARFGVNTDAVSGRLSPSLSARVSVQAVRDAMNFRIGSIEYMAPEMLNKPTAAEVFHLVIAQGIDEDDLPVYDEKVDVWSTGVVLYEALSGVQPFLADSAPDMLTVIGNKLSKRLDPEQQQQLQQQQQHHQQQQHRSHWLRQQQDLPEFIARLQLSADAKDLLAACLTWDPTKRATAAELLSHPWLQRMQDEAAAVAASRANSRRISMQMSMQRCRAAEADGGSGHHAAAAAVADFSRSKLLQPAGSAAEVSLVDPIVAGMLDGQPGLELIRQTSLDLTNCGLERSQTSEQLEVGVRNVLRTHTQRLEARPLHAHVHAA